MTAREQARVLFPEANIANDVGSFWAGALSWTADTLDRTSTSANSNFASAHEGYCGQSAPLKLLPSLTPGSCKRRCTSKEKFKAVLCFCRGLAKNHPQGTSLLLVRDTRAVDISRDVTWRSMPESQSPSPRGSATTPSAQADEEDDSPTNDNIEC